MQGNAELADISTGPPPLFGKMSPPSTYRHLFYGLKMKAWVEDPCYTVQKILSINLCSWSLCCIECKLGHYWTQKFFTSCTGNFCAAFELKDFTPNRMKKYVLLESPLPFFVWHLVLSIKLCWNWSRPSFKVVSLRLCYKFVSLVSALYSYRKIMVKLVLDIFQSNFTSPLL